MDYVFDGDTLRLTDDRRIRLLGIDTPEIGRDGSRSEPYANKAHALLREIAGPGTRVGLRLDTIHHDRYERTLAHLFLADGTNLQALLLARGLATTLVIPPNVHLHACYERAELQARKSHRGLWSHPHYSPTPADELPRDADGFRIVTGRVYRIGRARHAIWLNLEGGLSVRIPRADLDYFPGLRPAELEGRRVEVRGRLRRHSNGLRMTVRHPAALRILE